jgi:hypothetical protein
MSLKGNRKGRITELVLASLEGMEERVQARKEMRASRNAAQALRQAHYRAVERIRRSEWAARADSEPETHPFPLSKRQTQKEISCDKF